MRDGLRVLVFASLAAGLTSPAFASLPDLEPQRPPQLAGASAPASDGGSAPDPRPTTGEAGRFSFLEEDDAFGFPPVGPHTDNFYSQGARFSFQWAPDPQRWLARWIDEVLAGASPQQWWGLTLGQDIYTPSNIQITNLTQLEHDRPYAGWLYGGATVEVIWGRTPGSWQWGTSGPPQSHLYLEAFGGVTGPSALAGPGQDGVHLLLRDAQGNCPPALPGQLYLTPGCSPPPLGWGEYQTANRAGGGVTARYGWEVVRAGVSAGPVTVATGSGLSMRASIEGRATAATILGSVGGGVAMRAGLMEVPTGSLSRPRLPFQVFGYARVGGHLVGWNELINGPLLNGVQSDASPRVAVAEVAFGVGVRLLGFEGAFTQLLTTPEMSVAGGPGPEAPWHHVGEIQIAFAY